MKHLFVALCLIAGTWYLVSTNLKNDGNGIPLSKESASAPTSVVQNRLNYPPMGSQRAAGEPGVKAGPRPIDRLQTVRCAKLEMETAG